MNMKDILYVIILALVCCMALHANPPKEGKWQPIPKLTDEFEGKTLDTRKWHDHNPGWKGREPGFFSTKNVTVSDGRLHLTARAETLKNLPKGYHSITTAAVKSKTTVLYGYFEIRCKPMKSHASSAFWFYNNTRERWTEIDVFEICGAGEKWKRKYHMNAHVFHTPEEKRHWSKGKTWETPFDLASGYHVYGLEWSKDRIRWFVDGKLVREIKNTHWHQPLHMNFDSETMPKWFGLPDKKELPAVFSIDYIRSWKPVAHPSSGERKE